MIIDIIIIFICIFFGFWGYKKGLLYSVVSTFRFAIGVCGSFFLTSHFKTFLQSKTSIFARDTFQAINDIDFVKNIIAFVILFIIIEIVLFILLHLILKRKNKKSALNTINGVLGFVFGFLRGALLILVLLLVIIPLYQTVAPSQLETITNLIDSSSIATFLYDHNILTYLFESFVIK